MQCTLSRLVTLKIYKLLSRLVNLFKKYLFLQRNHVRFVPVSRWVTWSIRRDFRDCSSLAFQSRKAQSPEEETRRKTLNCFVISFLALIFFVVFYHFFWKCARGGKREKHKASERKRVSPKLCCFVIVAEDWESLEFDFFLSLPSLFHVFSLHSTLKDTKTFHTWVSAR